MLAPPPSPLTSVGLSAAQASEATASVWWSRLCRVCNRSMSQSWYHEHSASMTEYDTNRHRAQLSAHRCTQLAKGVRPLSGHVPMPPTAQSPAAKALVGAQYPRLASAVKLERASIVIRTRCVGSHAGLAWGHITCTRGTLLGWQSTPVWNPPTTPDTNAMSGCLTNILAIPPASQGVIRISACSFNKINRPVEKKGKRGCEKKDACVATKRLIRPPTMIQTQLRHSSRSSQMTSLLELRVIKRQRRQKGEKRKLQDQMSSAGSES